MHQQPARNTAATPTLSDEPEYESGFSQREKEIPLLYPDDLFLGSESVRIASSAGVSLLVAAQRRSDLAITISINSTWALKTPD